MKLLTHPLIGVLALSVALAGCGFQPRGTESASYLPEAYAVQVKSPYPQLNHLFERELSRQGFSVVRSGAEFIIQVHNESSDDLDFVFDREFEQPFQRLNYHIHYMITDAGGVAIIAPPAKVLTADYYRPAGNYLQQEVARDSALNQLRKNAVLEITNRLRWKLSSPGESQE